MAKNPDPIAEKVEKITENTFHEIDEIYRKEIKEREEQIDKLSSELEQIKSRLAGFINPDYGMLPVPAFLHEYVMELAQHRSTAPGVLMSTTAVSNFLEGLIDKEIL